MDRRHFLTASLISSGASAGLAAGAPGGGSREYYVLRRYHLVSGPQRKILDGYLAEALIPALDRQGIRPVGAFSTDIGMESPSLYLLLPATSVESLVTAELHLAQDEEYQKTGAAFLNAPAREPAYVRVESSLMIAFEGWPKLTVPPVTAQHGARVFELRTYESPTDQDHRRKVEMFHSGEFAIFEKAGFWQVFFGDTLVGARMPNLTYMLGFEDLSERNKLWKAFSTAPEWKKLSASARFSFEAIVSNVDNLMLSPTSYSRI